MELTKESFTKRTKYKPDDGEFIRIRDAYDKSGADRDEFCYLWTLFNLHKIEAQKAKARNRSRIKALEDELTGLQAAFKENMGYLAAAGKTEAYERIMAKEKLIIDEKVRMLNLMWTMFHIS